MIFTHESCGRIVQLTRICARTCHVLGGNLGKLVRQSWVAWRRLIPFRTVKLDMRERQTVTVIVGQVEMNEMIGIDEEIMPLSVDVSRTKLRRVAPTKGIKRAK